jgi:hypothetical protein
VQWTPGKDGQPTSEALAALWQRMAAFPPADAQVHSVQDNMPCHTVGYSITLNTDPVLGTQEFMPCCGHDAHDDSDAVPDKQRFRALPLVPVEGGRLASPAALPVISLGAWAPGVGSALTRLGCRLMDASKLPEDVVQVHRVGHGDSVCRSVKLSQITCRVCSMTSLVSFWGQVRPNNTHKRKPCGYY